MTAQIPTQARQVAPPDPREVETALELGQHRELVLEAMRTGCWDAVDAIPEPSEDPWRELERVA
jgi:hypothetical protein